MKIFLGDCLEVMKALPENSVDSVVTDPPYGLSFMNKHWDYDVPSVDVWREALRVLKPGGHLLSFGGDRTEHRMKVNIEDAGFEIRTTLAWNFGSGFPKSLNVTKALNALFPEHVRCACDQRSTQIAEDSQSDYHGEHDSGDAQLHPQAGSAQDASPLQGGVALHSRDDLHSDDLDKALAHSLGRSSIDPLSTEDFSRLYQRLESDSLLRDSIQSGTLANKFSAELKAEHKKAQHIQDKNHSEHALASSSFTPGGVAGIYHKCSTCQGFAAREGLGTALKPAAEFICMARKPLEKGLTVAANVLKWGTGGLNIDESRIEGVKPEMIRTATVVAAKSMAGESTSTQSCRLMRTSRNLLPLKAQRGKNERR